MISQVLLKHYDILIAVPLCARRWVVDLLNLHIYSNRILTRALDVCAHRAGASNDAEPVPDELTHACDAGRYSEWKNAHVLMFSSPTLFSSSPLDLLFLFAPFCSWFVQKKGNSAPNKFKPNVFLLSGLHFFSRCTTLLLFLSSFSMT